MRFLSAAVLVLVLATAAAQRPVGGMSPGGTRLGPPSLSNGNPFTAPNGRFGPGFHPGRQSWPRWGSFPNQQPPLGGNSLYFFGVREAPVYPPYPSDYYQQPPDPGPMVPSEDFTPAPVIVDPPRPSQDTHEAAGSSGEVSTAGTSSLRIYHVSSPLPLDNDDHPPLIALKNRWAYTALRYWLKGKNLHFITSFGDHMQVPVAQVERIYPSSRQSRVTDTTTPAAK